MGDCQNEDLRVDFDRTLKLKFLGSKVAADAGLLAYRELDEALRLTETDAESVQDSRLGKNTQHGPLGLLRQSIYSRLAGYEDVNDAERLCVDPAMRYVVGGRASREDKQAASMSEMGRFETETRHSKYVTFQLAEVAVPRQLFAAILERIGRLAMQPSLCPSG
jgi:hypothetical protein